MYNNMIQMCTIHLCTDVTMSSSNVDPAHLLLVLEWSLQHTLDLETGWRKCGLLD